MNLKYAMRSEDTEQIAVIQWAQYQTGAHPELKLLHSMYAMTGAGCGKRLSSCMTG